MQILKIKFKKKKKKKKKKTSPELGFGGFRMSAAAC